MKCMLVLNIFSKVLFLNTGFHSNLLLHFRKDVLRGALTNGREWIFLIIMSNGKGATYRRSLPVMFDPPKIGEAWPDLVTGILLHWVSVGLLLLIPSFDTTRID